jgi:hypothetical protein
MKPCPFCGTEVDLNDEDTLYPNGLGWREEEENMRAYCMAREVPKEQWCYSLHCLGCGVEMKGDTRQEAIDKWNQRV